MENSSSHGGAPGDDAKTLDEPRREKPRLSEEQKIGGYILLSKLGAGGIGEVWKARDPRLNRVVALKFIAAERRGSSPVRDLLREARAASALNHPNIVTIFEVGESAGSPFLAMEFVEGETLRGRLRRPPVPLVEALEVAQQILAGLAAAHRNGIVHRDLKPENIMLRVDGLLKLMDFGLAKVIPGVQPSATTADPASVVTGSGAIVGTLTYMSPEQARGFAVTPASDVFSFGIVFYELLTGQHPFQENTALDTLTAILSKEPESVSARSPGVAPALDAIATRALEKEVSRRYPSAIELLQDLKQARAASAVIGAAPAAPRLRAAPRWMKAVGAALIALILSLAGWRLRAPSSTSGEFASSVRSVAVMNFRAEPDDQSAVPLAQDLPDELGAALSKTGLEIASRQSVLEMPGPAKPRDIGAQLGVDAVLDGSVRTYGSKFKLNLELVSTRTGFQVWSETFTFDGEEALSDEPKTAAKIAQELRQAMAAAKSP